MSTETWFVTEDGSAADPREVSPGKDGRLRHKDGRVVAMRGDVPRSRGVDPDEERGKSKTKPKSRDMTPEDPKSGYKTRDAKAK